MKKVATLTILNCGLFTVSALAISPPTCSERLSNMKFALTYGKLFYDGMTATRAGAFKRTNGIFEMAKVENAAWRST